MFTPESNDDEYQEQLEKISRIVSGMPELGVDVSPLGDLSAMPGMSEALRASLPQIESLHVRESFSAPVADTVVLEEILAEQREQRKLLKKGVDLLGDILKELKRHK